MLRWLEQLPDSYVRKVITANKSTVDVFLCLGGIFIAIEIKRQGEKPTKLQEWNIEQIRKAGGWAFWTDNFEHLQTTIERIRLIIKYKPGVEL